MFANKPYTHFGPLLFSYLLTLFVSTSVLYTPSAKANLSCNRAANAEAQSTLSEEALFSNLEALESQIQSALTEATSKFGRDQKTNEDVRLSLGKLSELTKILDSLQNKALSEVPVGVSEIANAFSTLEEILTELRNPNAPTESLAAQTPQDVWKEIEKNPSLIKPETVYEVPLLNGKTLSVLFSENVVNEVFKGDDAVLRQSSQKAISKIKFGVFGGSYEGGGIKRLILDNEVLELGAIGTNAGTLRFGGYFYEGVLNFVFWLKYSEHDSSRRLMRFRDSVNAARRNRSH